MRHRGATGKLLIGLVLVLVVGLVAVACGGDDDELAAPAPAAGAAPAAPARVAVALEERGTLGITHSSLWGGLESIHPHSPAYWDPPTLILYERLINTNAQGVPGG